MFRALQGYFLTMLGKEISSQRRNPGNFAEYFALGRSNSPKPTPPPPPPPKRKASVTMLDELLYERVPAIKVIRGILNQKSPTVLLMWLLNINSSIWHLQNANSPIVNGKRNIYSANFNTFQVYLPDVRPEPAYEHCATILLLYIMCSKYVPALLWKLYMKIFNTLSILH